MLDPSLGIPSQDYHKWIWWKHHLPQNASYLHIICIYNILFDLFVHIYSLDSQVSPSILIESFQAVYIGVSRRKLPFANGNVNWNSKYLPNSFQTDSSFTIHSTKISNKTPPKNNTCYPLFYPSLPWKLPWREISHQTIKASSTWNNESSMQVTKHSTASDETAPHDLDALAETFWISRVE